MSITLFDDQTAVLGQVRQTYRDGARAPLLVAPCGFGKTVVFSAICKGAQERGNRVLILVHRQELVDQVSRTLQEFHVKHGLITPDNPLTPNATVQVASVFTLARRLAAAPVPHLLVIDEAHHAILRSTWGTVIAAFPRSRLLGVTATPTRLSGEGLGDIFDRLVTGPTTQALIDSGRLAPLRVFAPPSIDVAGVGTQMGDFKKSQLASVVDKPKITGDAVEHYQRLTPGKRAAVFCVSLEHAAHVAMGARAAGISTVQLDGQMDRQLRREVVKDFSNGRIQWLVTVDLISEGFDCPGIDVGISLRPTQSLALWLQQCGRVLRVAPGKEHAYILDHAGNSLRHGLPTEDRDWSLSGTIRRGQSGERAASIRVCPNCFSAQRSGKQSCAHCGAAFPVESRTVAKEKGTLEELTAEDIAARRARQQVGQTKNREALIALGRQRGYKDPTRWAAYVLAGRDKKRAAR